MKTCSHCEKGSALGGKRAFLRSHYNPTATVRKYPNLQWAKLPSGVRAKICTKCLKKLHKNS
jgi:ribosomal protein L28